MALTKPKRVSNAAQLFAADWRTSYVLQLIHEQRGNVQLSLKVLGDGVGVSGQHLGRTFRAAVGIPFRSYLRDIRTTEARRLLTEEPRLSVKQVAARLGYSECANFARDFRDTTQMTPIKYRQRIGIAPSAAPLGASSDPYSQQRALSAR